MKTEFSSTLLEQNNFFNKSEFNMSVQLRARKLLRCRIKAELNQEIEQYFE